MSSKRFPSLSIAAVVALAIAGCGGDESGDKPAPAAAQASTATTPAATTPTATAPAATTPSKTATTTTKSGAAKPATSPRPVPPLSVPQTPTAASRPSKPVALAVATTNRQAGALAFVMKGTVTTGSQVVPLSARGVFDRKSQRGNYTTKAKLGARAFTVQQIADKQRLYLRSPMFAGKLPGGKSWLKIDVVKAARVPGMDLDALGVSGPSQDPAQALDYLQGAKTAQRLGTAKVNGVATTRYRVQVDLKRAAARSSKGTAKRSIRRLISSMKGPTMLPIDVWVDGNNLVRRQRVFYAATVAGARSAFDITTDYTGYGVKLDARPPADGDTFDGLASLETAAKARAEAQRSQQTP